MSEPSKSSELILSSESSESSESIFNPPSISLPAGFVFGEKLASAAIHRLVEASPSVVATPSLGPLADFTGSWKGTGFNTIFRPDNTVSRSSESLPKPLAPGDNLLELNLTAETLTFSPSLGSVPNRGLGQQRDIHLNGIPYLQAINDVTDPHAPVGIHAEPGLWMAVESTSIPAEGPTVVRMASIPHGTTIEAQGTSRVFAGPPVIPSVSITPTVPGGGPVRFPSQTAANNDTPRTPQDLSSFIAAGTITQAILDNPNLVLQRHLQGQTILSTTQITIATTPAPPIVGGGTDNIAFLTKNAVSVEMSATFWIETVQHRIVVPVFKPGGVPLVLAAEEHSPGRAVPTFSVLPPREITVPHVILFTTKQIQYTQTVILNFNGLSWPHVSVATLVPAAQVVVPASAFA